MAKKKVYTTSLYAEIGRLRGLPDRISTVVSLVEPVRSLIDAIRADRPNIKGLAAIVGDVLERAEAAIAADAD